jgi:hypothetical protein
LFGDQLRQGGEVKEKVSCSLTGFKIINFNMLGVRQVPKSQSHICFGVLLLKNEFFKSCQKKMEL